MKKFFLVLVLCGFFPMQSGAVEGTLSLSVASENFLDNGSLLAGPVLNFEADFEIGRCVYANLWGSAGLLEGKAGQYGNRLEYTLGCRRSLWRKFDVDFGVTYNHFLNINQDDNGDAVQPYVRMDRPFSLTQRHTLRPFISVKGVLIIGEWDKLLQVDDGTIASVGLRHDWNLSVPIFEITDFSQEISVIYDSGAGALADDAVIGNYEAKFTLHFWRHTSLDLLSVRLVFPLTTNRHTTIGYQGNDIRVVKDAREFRWGIGAGVTYRF